MTAQQATIRAAVAALPWLFFGSTWIWGLWVMFQIANGLFVIVNDDRRNLYDQVAGTKVINMQAHADRAGGVGNC